MLTLDMTRLATLLCNARANGTQLTDLENALYPASENEADAVQWLVAQARGPVTGYKVARVGDGPGAWGAIHARDILLAPENLAVPARGLKFEVEVGFVLAKDLTKVPSPEGFSRAEVIDALEGAFLGVEVLGARCVPELTTAHPLLARADSLTNHAMLADPRIMDPTPFLDEAPVEARLCIDGTALVNGFLPHPSGRGALHPMIWLANALAKAGRGLRKGDRVITGSFGGAHLAHAGQSLSAEIAGLGALHWALTPVAQLQEETA
ncbi:2-keto-4-pentenoate hydratase [Rhodobacter sp. JA431]|uniref:fumarylacetoacetate hydrolase family protein n=1 Tax=Rhodobacter sp. JA431 TaxID=570013 RepID=UPI000BC68999|nr:fumarylacetoacetate hydrolase family protein [Rhodobacter sp. JA431]SOC07681.1 2-keto-4-pentenoate hydratase [Rhodobacter sp. JA431]